MFAPNVIIFTTIFASVVWAQSNMAQCGPGFDWVSDYPRFFIQHVDGEAERSNGCLVIRGFVE